MRIFSGQNRRIERAAMVLQIGLAFVFAYAAIGALLQPEAWIGYLPRFIAHSAWSNKILDFLSLFQLVLAGALFVPKFTYFAAVVAAGMLAGICFANLGASLIVFRDVGLIMMALSLAILTKPIAEK